MKIKPGPIANLPAVLCRSLAIAVLMFPLAKPAAAQDAPVGESSSFDASSVDIAERYPPGTIRSVEAADQALAAVERERSRVNAKFVEDERACYSKFFATSCIDAAKEERRHALVNIQQVEVQANAFKRRAKVEQRDKALAEKASQPAPVVKPPKQRKKSVPAAEEKAATGSAEHTDRSGGPGQAAQTSEADDRVARHQEKMEKLKQKEAADAQKRAENVAEFEKRVRDSEKRQREVAAKKAEKELKRAEKNPPRPNSD